MPGREPVPLLWPNWEKLVAVLTALMLTLATQAAPEQLLIFSGGKTEADAQRALKSFALLEPVLKEVVTLPRDYPRILESSKLPGLTAGFWIVALGVCSEPPAALAAIKAVYPGAYAKPLTGQPLALACPTLETMRSAELLESSLKLGATTLTAFVLTQSGKDDRGEDLTSVDHVFVRVNKATGEVVDLVRVGTDRTTVSGEGPGGREYLTCTGSSKFEKSAVVISRTCSDQRSGCQMNEQWIPRSWTETQRLSANGEKLTLSPVKRAIKEKSKCEASGSEGD
jgi:hypothetical protein